MQNISSILIPFDFSVSAYRALDYALEFVGQSAIEIKLLHIPDEIERTYDKIAKTYSKQLIKPIKWIFGSGHLADVIITTAEKEGTEIIMMGTSGLSDSGNTTNTAELVSKTESTVLVIPNEQPTNSIENITLVLGKEKIDKPNSLAMLLFITRRFNANVNVLTIKNTPEVYGYSEVDKKNETILEHYLEHFYKNHIYIENEDIVEGVLDYTKKDDSDLIVILPKHSTEKNESSKNELTRELVLKSKISVLTI